jgi:hypothetical protein
MALMTPVAPLAAHWAAASELALISLRRRIWRNPRDSGSVHPFQASSERERRIRKSPARRDPSPAGLVRWGANQQAGDAK